MDFEGVKKYIKSFVSYEDVITFKYGDEVFDLNRVRDFVDRFGIDYSDLKFVHVAGSKGKGTTSTLISDYLSKNGYSTGLFTSPYMFEMTECFKVDGENIVIDVFVKIIEELKSFIEKNGCKLTYFELLVVIALKYFSELKLDYVVTEVGLGGRLDATNIIVPEVSVITLVEKEHVDILGDNLSDILDEKLGIVKNDVPVFVGYQSSEGLRLIKKKLNGRNVVFVQEEEVIDLEDNDFAKVKNGKTAYLVLKKLLGEVSDQLFLKVFEDFKFLGRFDVRQINGKDVVFDMAHTKSSILNLIEGLKVSFPNKKFVFLVSLLKGKDVESILTLINSIAEKIVFTSSHSERGYKGVELLDFVEGDVIENPKESYARVFEDLKRDQVLVVTGSHFLLSIVMP